MTGDNLVGEILGERYEILEKIGSGGMATVYKSKDTLLNRNVAIKILRDSLEEEEQVVTNFVKEAQASAGLVHNNIVSVYDVGESNGLNYMVMELVDGITLKQYIKETGILPWQEACDYAIQIAQGLGEAHANNIIHCDIKPQNIIMTADKTVKVTDFGIAKAVSGGTIVANDKSGGAVGSVHYISPEQARGGYTDARSDIYSLGIVMYEMLAGKVPFDGDNPVGIAMKHLEEEPVNVKCVNFDIPTDLAAVVMKAINKNPEDRYQSAQEMLNDLHAVLAGEPLPSMASVSEPDSFDEDADDDDFDDFDDFDDGAESIINENAEAVRTRTRQKNSKKNTQNGKKTKDQKKANRTATLLAIVTVIAIVLIGFGVYAFVNNVMTKTTVPDFTNMTLEEAKELAEKNNLSVLDENIEYSISDTVEDGCVISHIPEAGESVEKNSEVKLVVSIGSRGGDISVPDLVNKTRDEALLAINDAQLKATIIEENSSTVAAGNVIRQTPTAGTKLFKDDYVTIYVSKGISSSTSATPASKNVTVPNLVGGSLDSARTALSELGLTLGNVSVVYSEEESGTIISQAVADGTAVAEGTSVGVVISGGTQPATAEPVEETPEEDNTSYTDADGETTGGTSGGASSSSSGGSATGTSTFFVSIPSDGNGDASVEVYVDGALVHEGTYSRDSGSIPVEITGSGTVNVTAYVDGVAQSQTINFD
ncbi:MAG: Stk1 family PASTA domain-containing Ser/Thr kinase [Firmicutes bacterium]|nr:Stk1 family PASTA domain-containing Ser/Thr kinase [Bacillota bacterium]